MEKPKYQVPPPWNRLLLKGKLDSKIRFVMPGKKPTEENPADSIGLQLTLWKPKSSTGLLYIMWDIESPYRIMGEICQLASRPFHIEMMGGDHKIKDSTATTPILRVHAGRIAMIISTRSPARVTTHALHIDVQTNEVGNSLIDVPPTV